MNPAVVAYLGLGSNLGDRKRNLEQAIAQLPEEGITVLRASPVYETDPVGLPGEPKFLNQVAEVRTGQSAEELVASLLSIEERLGRVRTGQLASRTLDLDLLLYGDRVLRSLTCTVPHPRMADRAFVLVPLAQLAPDLVVPVWGITVAELVSRLRGRQTALPFQAQAA